MAESERLDNVMYSGNSWHVIKTARFKETFVKSQVFESAGMEAFLPMVKVPKHSVRTGQNQIEPLFPGYLFARFDVATHLLTLRRLQGVQALLCFDGNPACVEPEIIEDLRRRERGRGYIN